jgi:transcriptional regulator with XRE-family HTH domain
VEGQSFARRLKEARRRRGWMQRELAEHAGVSLSEVQSIEQGRRQATRETARRLSRALDAELASAVSTSDDAYLTTLYRLAIERDGAVVGVVRRDTARLIAEHEALLPGDHGRRVLAKAHLIAGVSYQEAAPVPPMTAYWHLEAAQAYAAEVEDWHLHNLAAFCEATLHQKRIAVERRTAPADEARALLEQVMDSPREASPWLRPLAAAGLAEVALGAGPSGWPKPSRTAFKTAIAAGYQVAREARERTSLSQDDAAVWPSFLPERAEVILLNTHLTGAAVLGRPSTFIRKLADLTRRARAGLTEMIERVTINYALAQALCKEREWEEGLQMVVNALAFAREHHFRRQVYTGEQILRAATTQLPGTIAVMCPRCDRQSLLFHPRQTSESNCGACGIVGGARPRRRGRLKALRFRAALGLPLRLGRAVSSLRGGDHLKCDGGRDSPLKWVRRLRAGGGGA